MRILIVTSWLRYGGEGKVALGLSNGLRKNSCEVEIWTNRSIPKMIRGMIYTPYVPLEKLKPGLGQVYAIAIKTLFLPFLLFKEVLSSHAIITFTLEDLPATVLLAKFLRKKILFVTHGPSKADMIIQGFKNNVSVRLSYYIVKKISNHLNAHVVVSKSEKEELRKLGVDDRITVIYNGINIEEFDTIKKFDVNGSPSLFYAGRLEKIKGIDILLDAFNKIKKELPHVMLYLCGEGSLRTMVEEATKDISIKYLGFIKGKPLLELFMSIDFVIVPSFYDAFNLVVLEGMAAGKPVIVSKNAGSSELIQDGIDGLVIKPSSDEIVKAVLKLWNEKYLREQIAVNARKKARKLDWDNVAREYLRILSCDGSK
jgi:glycosyltransferase involved in cell wall biosynthesis